MKRKFWKSIGLTTAIGASLLLSPNIGHAKILDMDGHWGKTTVEQAIQDGWVEDTEIFNPTKEVSRIEAAVFLAKALGEDRKSNFKPKFVDVNPSIKEYSYLANLTKKGIFGNVTRFNPNNSLTRGQAATIIVKAFELEGSSDRTFKDVPRRLSVFPYVEILVANGVTDGKTRDLFGPHDPVTRVQLVTFIDRALKATADRKINLEELKVSPELFTAIMKNNGVSEEETLQMNVRSKQDFYRAAEIAYTELPKRIQLNTNMQLSELKSILHEWEQKTHPKDNINNMTLANYRVEGLGVNTYLIDNAHKEYNAIDIKFGVEKFAEEFSKRSAAKTDKEKLLDAYEYVYDNYTYSAHGIQSMLVGNMGDDTMACNGFSRLMYELTTAMGLEGEIIRGHEHIWNRIIVDGKEIIVDLSTDIYLNQKYLTLGMSTQEHISAGGLVNIYNTTFDQSIYHRITESHKDFMVE